MKIRKIVQIIFSFLKIGILSFGGGVASLPHLDRELVIYRKWLSKEELTDFFAISQSFPGVITVNIATLIGYRVCGFWGALAATVSSILPTFILMLVVVLFFWNYTDIPIVQKVFKGVLVGVSALIIHAMLSLWNTAVKNRLDLLLVILSSALLILFKVNAVYIILGVLTVNSLFAIHSLKKRGSSDEIH